MKRLDNKSAIVTGAAAGIGLGIARYDGWQPARHGLLGRMNVRRFP